MILFRPLRSVRRRTAARWHGFNHCQFRCDLRSEHGTYIRNTLYSHANTHNSCISYHWQPTQDYTITMYLNQYWRDERLAFNAFGPYYGSASDSLTLSGDFAEKIWVPDTFFANDKKRYCAPILPFNYIMLTILCHHTTHQASCTTSPSAISWCACPATAPSRTECVSPRR